MPAVRRSALVAVGVLLLAGCGGSRHATATTTSERTTAAAPVARRHRKAALTPAQKLGFPALAPGRVPGYVMVADRNNDRIIIVNPRTKRVVWFFPRSGDVKAGQSFHDPDDAFFTPGYKSVSTNEEYNQTIAEIDVRTHRIVWSFGHAGVRGSAYGYLSNPDDAYELPNGLFMVADIENCRVLFINRAHRVVREIGHAGNCGHNPPQGLSSPNGATPLSDGGVLVTEIGGWVDRISRSGRLLWTIRTPTSYPSDAQLLPNGNVLVAGFNTPGRVDEITPHGRVVWTYAPTGYWSLDRPSLAVNWPNGLIAITDDWHHRIVVIDKRTKRVIWSYGHLNQPGTAPGYMDKPDGLDLLPAVAPRAPAVTHTRARDTSSQASVQRIGSLPETLSKAAAVVLPGGRLMVLGGETGGASTDQVLGGTPAHLRRVGTLPAPTHDAAAALLGNSVYLFGGGQATSVDSVVRIDPQTGHAVAAGRIGEPLSDLGAVAVGAKAYLVGGYTGSRYATAVLRYPGAKVVSRLPAGTRYAGVAALGGRIYVAGGLTVNGPTDAVYEVALPGPVRHVATLPQPLDHAGMAALGGKLYLVGGTQIVRLDPSGAVAVVAHLPVSLSDPAVVAVGGRLVIVGGGTNGVYSFRP
jgi:hypothetical protein